MIPIEFLLMAFLAVTAVVISRLSHLFAAAMLTGMFSLLSAGLFTLMDAVDVAFTEAAGGAAGRCWRRFLGRSHECQSEPEESATEAPSGVISTSRHPVRRGDAH